MGKRKDRRFAANNTSRRVKLDLFAEPTGDLGGSDVSEGERKQTEPNNDLPNSPSSSSSGQKKTENPLLLLGQYSDDELEEESYKKPDDAIADSSLDKEGGLIHDGNKDKHIKSAADNHLEVVEQQQVEKDSSASDVNAEGGSGNVTASNSTISNGLNKQTYSSFKAFDTVPLKQHAPTDVTSQWKMILHEESSQYYYWNTETGQTSWEFPSVFGQTAGAYGSEYNQSGPIVTEESTLIPVVEPSYLQPVQNIVGGTDCSTSLTVDRGERNKSEELYVRSLGTGDHQAECEIDSAINFQTCQEGIAGPGYSNHVLGNLDTGSANDLPARLLSQSEGLLEKLRSLKKSHGSFHNNEQITKYILEVEVRHSDVKALILDTSPLLPFWLHTEKQLKRLEDGVNDEIYELAKSAVLDEIAEPIKSSPKEKLETDVNTENESEESAREGEPAQSGKTLLPKESGDADVDKSPSHSRGHLVELSDVTPSGEMLQKVGSPVVEDIDMDVDMEVEESAPVSSVQVINASDDKMFSQTEPPSLHTDVPPPPGEEWIPPPPSESEEVPPPPLESSLVPPPLSSDSLGGSYTVSQSYMQQPADYAAQYSLSYPESSYQYTADGVALGPNTQYYGHVDGSQVSLPQSTFYYEAVPGTSEVAPAAASAVEAYYNFNCAAPLFPVISSAETGSANYSIPSNSSIALEPSSGANDSAETATLGSASQSTDVTDGSSLVAKDQPKVKRLKKRTLATTSTLRSNKKVSSLVDKWKAAKEELNDSEEEEDEEDYGVLDRKRRREIEEWKSRQIASGEAKDNANFQPLGGDWRAKVKRRKERAGREANEEAKKKDEKQQKPDLTKLSAQLPSGWQAYWDESTNKVYYGNTITSKTSWTLPTTTS